jgi:recombination protein RecA
VDTALAKKLQAIEEWSSKINADTTKKGHGALVRSPGERIAVETIPTGSPSLDIILGGGWQRGRMVEIFGPEGSGKSTIAYQTIAELHRRNPDSFAILVDAEGTYDEDRGRRFGILDKGLRVLVPEDAESVLEAVDGLMKIVSDGKSVVDLVVIDSVPALIPAAAVAGEIGDTEVGVLARMMSKAVRNFNNTATRNGTVMIWINQIREKIGVMYGSPETTPGGRALKFYASVRLRSSKIKDLKEGEDVYGQITKYALAKNKTSGQRKPIEVTILHTTGVDTAADIVKAGVETGIIVKAGGGFYSFVGADGVEVRQRGEATLIDFIKADQKVSRFLYDAVVAKGIATRAAKIAVSVPATAEASGLDDDMVPPSSANGDPGYGDEDAA